MSRQQGDMHLKDVGTRASGACSMLWGGFTLFFLAGVVCGTDPSGF